MTIKTTTERQAQKELAKENLRELEGGLYQLNLHETTEGYEYRIPSPDVSNIDVPLDVVSDGGFAYTDSIESILEGDLTFYEWTTTTQDRSKHVKAIYFILFSAGYLFVHIGWMLNFLIGIAGLLYLPILIDNIQFIVQNIEWITGILLVYLMSIKVSYEVAQKYSSIASKEYNQKTKTEKDVLKPIE